MIILPDNYTYRPLTNGYNNMAQVLSFTDYQNLIWLSLIQSSNWVKEKTGQIREG
jgi:hypothetical protein